MASDHAHSAPAAANADPAPAIAVTVLPTRREPVIVLAALRLPAPESADARPVEPGGTRAVTWFEPTKLSRMTTGPLPCTPPLKATASPTRLKLLSSLSSIRERSIVADESPPTNSPPPMLPCSTVAGHDDSTIDRLPAIVLARTVTPPDSEKTPPPVAKRALGGTACASLSTTCESISVSGPFEKIPPPSASLASDGAPGRVPLRLCATVVRMSVRLPAL